MYKFKLPHEILKLCNSKYIDKLNYGGDEYSTEELKSMNSKYFEEIPEHLPKDLFVNMNPVKSDREILLDKIMKDTELDTYWLILKVSLEKYYIFEQYDSIILEFNTYAFNGIPNRSHLRKRINHIMQHNGLIDYAVFDKNIFSPLIENVYKFYHYDDLWYKGTNTGAGQVSGWMTKSEAKTMYKNKALIELNYNKRLIKNFTEDDIIDGISFK